MPRVIAGQAKGTILKAPPGDTTRPTADRTKEAVFSSLAGRVSGARVLDICAGSGQLGIEALSRGAESLVLIEQSKKACAVIRENLSKTGFSPRAKLLPQDLTSALRKLEAEGLAFDLVFIDPPYAKAAEIIPLTARFLAKGLLAPDGIWVTEEASLHYAGHEGLPFELLKQARYGAAMISYYAFPEPERAEAEKL